MIRRYKNGNVYVAIDDETGTKSRLTLDDEFQPKFAECCDVHISDMCDNGCEYCYAGCTLSGKHGNFDWPFLNTLHPHTEMALNLQCPVPPKVLGLLKKLKEKQIIVNVTINQNHFMRDQFRELVKQLQDDGFIYGVGISITDLNSRLITLSHELKNVIFHVINGIVKVGELFDLGEMGEKVLVLGYKDMGRGHDAYITRHDETVKRMNDLAENIGTIIRKFNVISFDNLALEQLNIKKHLTDDDWDRFYQGDDGSHTFFINLVDGTFGLNSLTTKEERMEISNKSIDEMFEEVKKWQKEV